MEFKGKKVLVVGLGKSGLAAALFLRRRGAQVTVSDIRSAEVLGKDIPALLEEGIAVEAGGHGLLTFRRQDLIVVSPGVPLDTPELVQVKAFGLPIIGELELASQYLKGKSLAITGSNGKTTTTALCGAILAAGKLPVQVGGNIGVPVIALVDHSSDDSWSVLEVSSFQLETTDRFRPEIAVILNVTPDHLDRHGSFENYTAAKERIFANQTAEDTLVLNADDDVTSRMAARAKSRIFWFSTTRVVRQGAFVHEGAIVFRASEQGAPEFILKVENIPLKGHHNVENVLAAVCAARLAGTAADAIREAVESFKAVEHRLEFVASINGVDYYNDSKATNVDATAKAIAAFPTRHSPYSWRQGQELRLPPAATAARRAREGGVYHRRGCGEDRDANLWLCAGRQAPEPWIRLSRKHQKLLSRARSCCSRPRVRASISLKTTSIAGRSSKSLCMRDRVYGKTRRRR